MNLIEITAVPISIELKVKSASLVREHETIPKVNVTKDNNDVVIKQDSIKVNMDAYPTNAETNDQGSNYSGNLSDFITFSYNATASIDADATNAISAVDGGAGENPVTEIALKRFQKSLDNMLSYLPSVASNVSWDGTTLNMQYELDEQSLDWQALKSPSFEFIPGSIEFDVKELPNVKIEYIGEPIYFPKSANPNYVDLDIKA